MHTRAIGWVNRMMEINKSAIIIIIRSTLQFFNTNKTNLAQYGCSIDTVQTARWHTQWDTIIIIKCIEKLFRFNTAVNPIEEECTRAVECVHSRLSVGCAGDTRHDSYRERKKPNNKCWKMSDATTTRVVRSPNDNLFHFKFSQRKIERVHKHIIHTTKYIACCRFMVNSMRTMWMPMTQHIDSLSICSLFAYFIFKLLLALRPCALLCFCVYLFSVSFTNRVCRAACYLGGFLSFYSSVSLAQFLRYTDQPHSVMV